MSKKLLFVCGTLICTLNSAHATQFYLSPAFSYMSNKTDTVTFQGYAPKFIVGIDNDPYCGPIPSSPTLYLAAEIWTTPFKAFTIHDTDSEGTGFSLKPEWSFGITVLPGVNLDAVLKVYGRIGYVKTRFTDPNTATNGYQLGLGGEYKLSRNWAGRLDYIHTYYSSVGTIGSPRMDEVMLSVLYRLI